MMRRSLSALVAVACLSIAAQRAAAAPLLADFEDVTLGSYSVGQSITSGGITFNVEPFGGTSRGSLTIHDPSSGVGTGHEIWNGSTFIDVELEGTASQITFDIGTYFGSNQIMLNGETRSFQTIAHLESGGSLGGVDIEIIGGTGAHQTVSTVQLSGAISEFAIGGYEMGIDNVAVVPEPSAAVLVLAAAAPLLSRRRRR